MINFRSITLLLSILAFFNIVASAQVEQPKPKELSTFAPANPQQGDAYFPKRLANKNVAAILIMNKAGLAVNQTFYNTEGWPEKMETGSQVITYHYAPDKKRIKTNNEYVYDLDAKGNITQYWQEDRYGNTLYKTVNSYDDKGNLIRSEKFKRGQVKKGQFALRPTTTTHYKYDDKNRKIAELGAAYEYNYSYEVLADKLIVSVVKGKEKFSAYTYDKNGVFTDYKFFKYGNTTTHYENTYNSAGLLLTQTVTSTQPGDNTTKAYVITYRDGKVESPDTDQLEFMDPKKSNNVYTQATTKFSAQDGFFEKGVLNGPGFMSKNGMQYKGNFVNGKLSGFGQTHLPVGDKRITFGLFENGLLNGYGFVVSGSKVVEAGIYKNGKLVKNLDQDLLSRKATMTCEGNCTDGFGLKKDSGTLTYSFFEGGNAVGPYFIMKDNKMIQYGAKTKDFHFLEGVVNGNYYFGLWNTKKGKAKIVKKTAQGLEAGIIQDGTFVKKYEVVLK